MKWLKENHPLISVFIVLASLFAVGALNQQPPECRASNPSSYKCYQAVDDYTPYVTFRDQVLTHEPVANPKPKRDEWRSERDLIAQSDMAKWAFWMLIVSGVMAVLSAIGIGLVLWTLRETMKAGEMLSEQNDIALMTSELELSPVISVGNLIPHHSVMEGLNVHSDGFCQVTFKLMAKNSGPIPATIVGVFEGFNIIINGEEHVSKGDKFRDTSIHLGPDEEKDVFAPIAFRVDPIKYPKGTVIERKNILFSVSIILKYEDSFSWKRKESKLIKFRFFGGLNDTDEAGRSIVGVKRSSVIPYVKAGDVHPSKRQS